MEDSLLFMIIGTGGKNDRESYFNVLCKAITGADAKTVMLIISGNAESKAYAAQIEEKLGSKYNIEKKQLPAGYEFDADKCYEQFDTWLGRYAGRDVTIDITHGTKAMSAALYALGLQYNVTDFQYTVKKRNPDGSFADGAETVEHFDAAYARWKSLFKQAKMLFGTYQFSAVRQILNEKPPKNLKRQAEQCLMLSDFYSAWDRFDYKEAQRCAVQNFIPQYDIPEIGYKYDDSVGEVLSVLSKQVTENINDLDENIKISLHLLFDLYANYKRRLKNKQYEDASIRVYRMVELMGQILLMKKGIYSDHVPTGDKNIQDFILKNNPNFKDRYCKFSRTSALQFLIYDGVDEENKEILEYLRKISGLKYNGSYTADDDLVGSLRNKSVLIHGFGAKGGDTDKLEEISSEIISHAGKLMQPDDYKKATAVVKFLNENFRETDANE